MLNAIYAGGNCQYAQGVGDSGRSSHSDKKSENPEALLRHLFGSMKIAATTALLVLALSASLTAANNVAVRRDTHFPVVLQSKTNTESAQVGDRIIFRTSEAVLIGNNIVVPSGAEVLGTIDEVRRQSANAPHSDLVIRFHSVRWPGGSADLNAVVSSVEVINQNEKSFFRHIHNLFSQKTLLEHINVYAHIQRNAFTEFSSDEPGFVLRPGIRLVLRHLDPDKEPDLMVRNLVLDVNRSWKN